MTTDVFSENAKNIRSKESFVTDDFQKMQKISVKIEFAYCKSTIKGEK